MQNAVAVLVSGVVTLFGVTSAVLGFIAESKKLTLDQIYVSGGQCVHPANPASGLAVGAIFLLVVAQLIATGAGGCCSCCRPPGGAAYSNSTSRRRRVVGVFASLFSWVAALSAVAIYCIGAALNTATTRPDDFTGRNKVGCYYYLNGGFFLRAAVLSLVATALGIMSCVLLRLPTDPEPVLGQPGVGLPQWPTQGYGQEAYPQGYQEHPQVKV